MNQREIEQEAIRHWQHSYAKFFPKVSAPTNVEMGMFKAGAAFMVERTKKQTEAYLEMVLYNGQYAQDCREWKKKYEELEARCAALTDSLKYAKEKLVDNGVYICFSDETVKALKEPSATGDGK